MRKWSRYVVSVVAVTGLFVAGNSADAETCTLEMRKVAPATTTTPGRSTDYLAKSTYPQSFFQQLGGPQGMIVGPQGGSKAKFSDVVTKEPEYVADTPFRGVAVLGSQGYGFALDTAPPKEEEEKEEGDDAKKEDESGQKEDAKGGLLTQLGKALASSVSSKNKAVAFTRLYFDKNHNGDLTDDEVIEASSSQVYSSTNSRSSFPTVELTIEVDGHEMEYAFAFRVYSYASSRYAYANASLNSAAYRTGEIEINGKKRRVLLVDFNSNGRFDDAASVDAKRRSSNGTVYPTMGDMLYLDPDISSAYRSPYDPTSGGDQHYVGEMVNVDGRFFDLKIDPGGETLSLEPSSVPVGYVSNPNADFRAIVYGDRGMLEIAPDDSGKAPLPEGNWKLLSYTIQKTPTPKPEEKKENADDKGSSPLDLLSSDLQSATVASPVKRPLPTLVSARATADFKPVKVVAGESAQIQFGPPYTPRVESGPVRSGQTTMSLSLNLIGSGGEVCSDLRVEGRRPTGPEFTISTADGEEVDVGKFKYG